MEFRSGAAKTLRDLVHSVPYFCREIWRQREAPFVLPRWHISHVYACELIPGGAYVGIYLSFASKLVRPECSRQCHLSLQWLLSLGFRRRSMSV